MSWKGSSSRTTGCVVEARDSRGAKCGVGGGLSQPAVEIKREGQFPRHPSWSSVVASVEIEDTKEIILVMPIKNRAKRSQGKIFPGHKWLFQELLEPLFLQHYFFSLTTVSEPPTVALNFTRSLLCSRIRVCQIPETTCMSPSKAST